MEAAAARPEDLAVFGAAPAFAQPLHVGRPNVGRIDRYLGLMRGVLERRWLTNGGPLLREFEEQVAALAGVRHCVATANATLALQVAARALGLTGEVIVPSFTFVATAHALRWLGIRPVFCDVDAATHTLDPAAVEALVGPRTSGIVGVHVWGRGCDVPALTRIARRHGLALLFDASHAFACSFGGRMAGGFGEAEVFSFHATKFLNTFEGGALLTQRDDVAAAARGLINFGFAGEDSVLGLGINAKMSEAAAAMGLTGMESLDEFADANRANYEAYRSALQDVPGLSLLRHDGAERANRHHVVVEVHERETALSRDELRAVLRAENVLARRYFFPGCHRMEPYRREQPAAGARLPATEALCQRVLNLPTGTAVTAADAARVSAIVRTALLHAERVRAQLRRPAASTRRG